MLEHHSPTHSCDPTVLCGVGVGIAIPSFNFDVQHTGRHLMLTIVDILQGIKSRKITGWNKLPIHPANWITGVDYTAENNNEPGNNDDNDDEFCKDECDDYQEDAELDDEDAYDRVDRSEIDELLVEQGVDTATNQEANPTIHDEPEQANV
jgi:hypothetical protein